MVSACKWLVAQSADGHGDGTVTHGIIGVRTEEVWWGAPLAPGGVREHVA